MSVTRQFKWDTSEPDIVKVVLLLEPVLDLCFQPVRGSVRERGYTIRSDDTDVRGAVNLVESIARMGENPQSISISYRNSFWGPGFRRESRVPPTAWLTVSAYTTGSAARVSVGVSGPDTDSTYGFADRVRNRMTVEIQRGENSDWAAAPVQVATQWWSRIGAIARHPFWSALLAGLICAVVGAVLAVGVTQFGWMKSP